MTIKDFINVLSQYDPDTELVIKTEDAFVSPNIKREVVSFKHKYNGVYYKDNAIVLSEK